MHARLAAGCQDTFTEWNYHMLRPWNVDVAAGELSTLGRVRTPLPLDSG
jgi:hypothetical protein